MNRIKLLILEDTRHLRTPLYATCLAVQGSDSGAPSHWSDGSDRWFVDTKRLDPGTVTHLSLVCRFQVRWFPCSFYSINCCRIFDRAICYVQPHYIVCAPRIDRSIGDLIDRRGAWCCVPCMSRGILHGVYDRMGDERICCMTVILAQEGEGIWIPLRRGVRVD